MKWSVKHCCASLIGDGISFRRNFAFIFVFTCMIGAVSAMPPSADPLPDLGPFSCYADIPVPDTAVVTGETTDCGGPVTVTFIADSPNPGCNGTVIRTYRLADTCGVTTDIQQNIFINDIIPPTANSIPPLGPFSCYTNIPVPNASDVTGESDNCGGVVTVSHAGDSPDPGCSGTVIRTYLLTDVCGNTSLVTQSITIADIIPPVIISCPADVTASCPANVPLPNPSGVAWSDNCGTATVTHVSDETLLDYMQNGIYCTSYLTRTYRVTDLCGNFVQCEQLITIQDICVPQYDCPTCEDIVPHFDVDFTENPDSSWVSPPVVREGTCCAQLGPPPPRCIHFTLTLPPSVVAISFNIESGAVPSGSLFYQIDCNEVHQVGDTICLLGNATYELTFCKPGNNENTYSITAFSGNIIPDTIHTQVDCAAEISVEGIVESTAVWSDITGGGIYESYLSCLAGCLTTTFIPDSNAPPFILYEVCGDRGALICGLSAIICDTIMAIIHPKIIASINPNPAVYCVDDIGSLTGSVTPAGTYSMLWFNGPNGTGSVVGTGTNYTPVSSGNYSFVVSDLVNDYVCGEDTANVQVTIVPLPQFELGPDTALCTEATVFFDLPNGPQYTWVPSTGVIQGADPSQFTITASTTTNYTVTAVTSEGCEWTDTWSINVVSCMIECPVQAHCSAGDIIVYQTVAEFISAGGTISLPCNIQPGSISLVSSSSDGLACPETITHTYEIEDDCGNMETCNVVITLDDIEAPVWTGSPAPVGPLSCTQIIPVHETLTASDNCGVIINTSIDPYEPDYCNGFSITLRWTLIDSCGNSAPDQTLVVNILPQEPAVFIDPPANDTAITCDDVANIVIPDLAYDNGQIGDCQISGSVPGVMNGPVNECGGQFTIEWNFTDSCGRSITHIQNVTVSDDLDPVITCPTGLDFECNAEVPPQFSTYADFIAGGGTASDNCGLLISSFAVSEADNGTCPRTITRTYSIADSCGNTAQCIQTITVDDNESPVMTCPGDLVFECSGDVPAAYTNYNAFINGGGSVSDNCGVVESSFAMTESQSGTCPMMITRTYSIADSCGNTGQCVQTITVDDQESPVITCPGSLTFSCLGDVPAPFTMLMEFINGGGSASDNCGLVESSFTVTETNTGNCPQTIMRTYSIADSCGNTGQCIQTITVDDPEPPFMTCPANMDLECVGDVPPALATYTDFINGGGSVTDNCGINESTFTVNESASGTCPKIIVRTYTIADSCGNIAQCVQTINVDDSTTPVITCPSNENEECTGNIPPAFTTLADFLAGGGSASDNCALDPSSFSMNETDMGSCPRTITRTYSIADSCGNTAQCVQTINIDDTTPPVITCPANVNEECNSSIPPAFTTLLTFIAGGGNASDNCALDASSFTFTETGSGLCPRTIIRTYQIADSCGNTGQCVQTIIIDDMTPPILTCPANENEECSANINPAFTTLDGFIAGGGSASDNCALDESSFTVTETDEGICPRTITRTYEIADSCGNTGQCVQTIIVDDPEPPVVTCPADLNFECIGDVPPSLATYTEFINGGGNTTDNCVINESTFSVTESSSGLCPRIIIRTYSIEDSCGNTGQCVQTITVDDPQPPVVTCPSDLDFECIGDVPPAPATYNEFINSGGSATDNCGIDASTYSLTESSSGTCPKIIIRTYSIADSCGNIAQCVQTITVDDPEPPVMTCPANMDLECVGDVPPALATYTDFINGGGSVTDNCGINESTFTVNESASGTCPKIIVRTYTIADSCGNIAQCVQTITVDDSTPPVITCPGNTNDECSANIPPAFTTLTDFLAGGGSASDNCALDPSLFSMNETDMGTCPRTITRTYSIADSCGNTAQCVQMINIDDTTPPVITCPGNINEECSGNIPPVFTTLADFIAGGGSASDNCSLNPSSFTVTASDNGTCPRTIIRTYIIADSCGNTGQCVQTIIIDDTTPPVITCPADVNEECSGNVTPAYTTLADFIAGGGTAMDNCALDESSFTFSEMDNGTCPRTITRTYEIADSCGNTGQCVQTITVDDPEPPVVTCPADLNFECIGDVPPPVATYTEFLNSGGNATDNCAINESTFTVTESSSGLCPRIIIRTYSIEDSCGNTGQCVQTITVNDPQPPVVTCPSDVDFECIGDVPPAPTSYNEFINSGGSATDNCGIDVSTFSMTESVSGMCPKIIIRTYSIADSCGNTGQCVQTITVDDPEPPVMTCPASLNLECVGDIPPALANYTDFINGGGSVTDNCGIDESTFTVSESVSGSCPKIIVRTYTLADSCGNIGQCVQTITVDDPIPPVITCPDNVNDECGGNIPPALTTLADFLAGGGTASDNCALDESSFSMSETDNGICPRTITRTYSIADSCGNENQCVQTIIVDDQINPEVTCPGDLMFECSGEIPALLTNYNDFINGGGNATDNCALDLNSFTAVETDNGTCPRTITRTYTIADSCGNVGQCVQTINVDDQVNPIITCPGDLLLECSGEIPALLTSYADFINGGGSASDNCSLDESTFAASETINGTCPRTITRTYSVVDSCGNMAECVQTITVDDQIDPVITCPGDLMFECTGDVPPLANTLIEFINAGGSASDNCALDESSFAVTETDNGTCPRMITRTYSIADSCGNIAECVQTITVDDQIDPVITCPGDQTLECIGDIPPAFTTYTEFISGGGSASDNCDLDETTFSLTESDNGTCPRTIIRTYSIADSCGNTGQCVQTIMVDDAIPPTASNPAPITIECAGEVPAPDPSLVTDASDNCSIPVVAFVSDESDGGMCPEVITRTYSVTDECDNQILVTQTITIGDDEPPTATAPAPINIECSGDVPAPDPSEVSASDNCSVPVVAFVSDVSDGGTCPEVITRTYSVTDECDNQILVTQVITIGDDTPPVFPSIPENLILECENEIPLIPELEYTDNCSPGGIATGTETGPVGDPPVITWTWTATDDCGNTTTVSVTITMTENTTVTNLTDQFCAGDIYILPDSTTTTVGGTYGPYVFTGSTGCDSIVNLDLSKIDPVIITINDAFCEGDTYTLPDGSTTNEAGSYGPYLFETVEGCDSTVFVELTLLPDVIINLTDEFCEGATYILPDGSIATEGGSFGPYEFINEDGCDSIINLELVEISIITIDLTDEFCSGDIYTLPDGSTTTTGGNFGPYVYTSVNGCDSIVNLTLTEIGPPNVDITDPGPVCLSSGIITLVATPPGGVWSGDVNSDQFDPLQSGVGIHEVIYTVTTGGCETADTLYITVYELELSCEALTEESYPGAADGTASVTVSGGIPPYSVTWSGPVSGSEILNEDGTFIITSLTAGVYTVVVEDAEGCIATCVFTIIADVPCELTIEEILPKDATCNGINNGSITVSAGGNMPPFEYSLDGINYQSSNVFDLLPPGNYTVYVIDNAGCIQSQNVTIVVGEGPELSILEIVDATCGINNGSIEVSVSGGSSPYLYSIDGAGYGLSNLFPGLFAGDYFIYLIDDVGCTDTIPATVGASEAPVIVNINVVNASCGLFDGSISIEANGGLGVLQYSINGGLSYQSSPVFNGLGSGNYFIVVKDEADCQATGTANIQETGGPVIDAIVATPTGCGESDGSITITATGSPVLQYSINGIQFQVSGSFQGLPAGNYIVTVRDGNGCKATGPVTINTTDGPLIQNLQHTNTKCGLEDGTITITASGGTGEIEYLLNGESYGNENFIQDLPSGVYLIAVLDENGCSATDEVTINSSEGPDFDVYITPAHCGMADGIIELDGFAGTPPYSYSINGSSFTANFTFVNKPSEYYTVRIKDANGCIYEEEVFIWETTGPEITDVVVTDPDCGMTNGTITITGTGTDLQYSILTPPVFQSTPQFDSVGPGTYTVIIRDKFNCRDQSTAVITPKPLPVISLTPTDSECGMSSGSILVTATGGTAPFVYKLDQGVFSSSNFFGSLPAGNYSITVQGANGCEATGNVTINADGVQTSSLSASICDGGIYELNGNVYSSPGTYSMTLQGGASNGCDSVITLALEVIPLQYKTIQGILCPGEIYTVNGVDYALAGQYIVDTIPGMTGCDTILTLDLLAGDYETKYIDAGICQGDVYQIEGVNYEMPGEYIIDTISVTSGCDSIRILRLEVNPLPVADAGTDHVLDCDVQTVILAGSTTGGEPFWTGPGINAGNANELQPQVTQPGIYTLTVTSPKNCVQQDVAIVNVDPETVIADAGPDAFLSCDIDSVILHANPVGPDLVYQWSGPGIHSQNEHSVSPVITVPGIYTLVVTNTSTACVSLPDTLVIADITADIIAIVQDPNSLDCFSTFIDLNATGSSTGSNLVYIWFNSLGEIIGNTPVLSVSSGGMFTFLVKDTISGCFDRDSVSVTDLIAYPPVDAGDPAQIDCYNETVVLNEGAQNNLPNLVFLWTGPPGGIIGPDTLLSVVAGASGFYYLQAEDTITGCKNIDSVMVTDASSEPIADIQVIETITCIDSTALLNNGLSSSGPEITYSWSGPGVNGLTTAFIESLSAGLFTLTVLNTINGCSSVDTVILELPEQLLDLDTKIEIPICEGEASGSIIVTGVTGGVPEFMYSINGQSLQASPLFENLTAGVYSIMVTDGNGCTYSESLTLPDGIALTIDIGIDIELVLGDSITLAANVSLPWSQVDSLVWTPSDILSCDHCINPELYGLHDNVITATVYSGGCFAEDMISLRVDINAKFLIPNVFSPNGDGINDHVTVFTDPRVKRIVSLEIFDRWGNNVFAGADFPPNDPLLGWDGTFKNQPMNPAVFAYIAVVELINGDYAWKKGDITLVR